MKRFFGSAFGVAVLGCLVLAGWAVWSAGVFDSPVARQLRSASVYVAPGITLDQPAAERVIGNRRLVVGFFEPGADLSDACDSLGSAVDGTLAVMLSRTVTTTRSTAVPGCPAWTTRTSARRSSRSR